MKTVVCFDLDGTLINSAAAIYTSLSHACHKAGVSPPKQESLISSIGPPLKEYLPGLLKISKDKCGEIAIAFREHHDCEGYLLYKLYPGAATTLSLLAENGHYLYVVSSKPYATSYKALKHFNLTNRFQNIYCPDGSLNPSDLDNHSKLTVINYIRQRHHPSGVAYIGDTIQDQKAAEGSGAYFIHATYGYGQDLKSDRQISKLNELVKVFSNKDDN